MKKLLTIVLMSLCVVAFTSIDTQARPRHGHHSRGARHESLVLMGDVGGTTCVMFIDGAKGHYSMEYNNNDNVDRQLRRVSHGVYKAYLHGRHIGTFRGTFSASGYRGRFVSVRGGSSPFNLEGVGD